MAGKYGSGSIWFLVDGYNLILNKLQGLTFKQSSALEPSHGLGDTWEESLPSGLSKAELTQEGAFWDTTTNYIHTVLTVAAKGPASLTPQSAVRVLCLGFMSTAIGSLFKGIQGAFTGAYEVLSTNGKLTRGNVEYAVSGKIEEAVVLHALTAETADGTTEASSVDSSTLTQQVVPITSSSVANPSTITCSAPHGLTTGDTVVIAGHSGSTPDINGEQTVTVVTTTTFTIAVNVTVGGTGGSFTRGKTQAGGAGYLQCTELTLGGYTDLTVKCRHSADNITFADLVTFTGLTAIGAQRVEVAGTVNRYLASSHDFTGAGAGPTATFLAGFARF